MVLQNAVYGVPHQHFTISTPEKRIKYQSHGTMKNNLKNKLHQKIPFMVRAGETGTLV